MILAMVQFLRNKERSWNWLVTKYLTDWIYHMESSGVMERSHFQNSWDKRPLPSVGRCVIVEKIIPQVVTIEVLGESHSTKDVHSILVGPGAEVDERIMRRNAPGPQSCPVPWCQIQHRDGGKLLPRSPTVENKEDISNDLALISHWCLNIFWMTLQLSCSYYPRDLRSRI